jgi:hypothetical protein
LAILRRANSRVQRNDVIQVEQVDRPLRRAMLIFAAMGRHFSIEQGTARSTLEISRMVLEKFACKDGRAKTKQNRD